MSGFHKGLRNGGGFVRLESNGAVTLRLNDVDDGANLADLLWNSNDDGWKEIAIALLQAADYAMENEP